MSALSLVRSPAFLVISLLGLVLVIAAACNGDGDGDGGDGDGGGRETPTADETPAAGGDTAEIKMLPGTTFDTSNLAIAADTDVVVTADNTDGTHNFAVYISMEEAEDPAIEPIGQTAIDTAPFVDTVTLNLAAGDYFFRCEVHPNIMTGTLTAE